MLSDDLEIISLIPIKRLKVLLLHIAIQEAILKHCHILIPLPQHFGFPCSQMILVKVLELKSPTPIISAFLARRHQHQPCPEYLLAEPGQFPVAEDVQENDIPTRRRTKANHHRNSLESASVNLNRPAVAPVADTSSADPPSYAEGGISRRLRVAVVRRDIHFQDLGLGTSELFPQRLDLSDMKKSIK
jgi:hypothetical protein